MEEKTEFRYGAILYKEEDNGYKYLIIRDKNDNYSFPKVKRGAEEEEKEEQTVIRGIKEMINIDLDADKYFRYDVRYHLNDTTTKHVIMYMGDLKNQVPSFNDPDIKEILLLNYEDAYNLLSFPNYKDALKEVNDRLVRHMKICCMFDYEDQEEAHNNRDLSLIKNYKGDYGIFEEGGLRSLHRCKKCGGYVLRQEHDNSCPDRTYIDYFPVIDEQHADEVNDKYNAYEVEFYYPYKRVFVTINYE